MSRKQHAVVVEGAADAGFEALEQVVDGEAAALFPGDVEDDVPGVHHEGAVAEIEGGLHVVGDHEAGEMVLLDDLTGELQDLFRRAGVQGGGMLVQEKELRVGHGGHHEGEGLALAPGEEADGLLHAVLEPHVQQGQAVAEGLLLGAGHVAEPAASARGEGQVLLNRHAGGAAQHGVLEEAADDLRPLILREEGDVAAVEDDASGIGIEAAGDGVEEGGLPCPVGADDGNEVARVEVEREVADGALFVHGAGVEGLGDVGDGQHVSAPPSLRCPGLPGRGRGGGGAWGPGP